MLHSSSALLSPLQPPALLPPTATHRRAPTPVRRWLLRSRFGASAAPICSCVRDRALHMFPPSITRAPSHCFPSSHPGRSLEFRSPGPELGLVSLVFVIFVVIGSFFAVAVISFPLMGALRKLSTAMKTLSRVVVAEVPGTLLSLKLSGWEINELSQQLSNLRRIILGNEYHGEGDQMNKRRRTKRGGDDPLIV